MLMIFAFALTLAGLVWGIQAVRSGGNLDGIPAAMFFIFGGVALIGGVSDVRVIRAGSIRGVPRVVRHLWRMCFAMWIATASFFLGQTEHIPEMIRRTPVLVTLAFLPLVIMFYWMWRLTRSRGVQRFTTSP